ncbi:MAG: hypothetical protein R3C10_13735 [Pirellulales bacterium]
MSSHRLRLSFTLPWLVVATACSTVLMGCDERATEERIDDKQAAVSEWQDDLEKLEDEKEVRIEQAAAAARKETRSEIETAIADTKARLQQGRQELADLEHRESIEDDLDQDLTELANRVNALETRRRDAEPSADENANQRGAKSSDDSLRGLLARAREQFHEMQRASQEAWPELRVAAEHAREELRRAADEATVTDVMPAGEEPLQDRKPTPKQADESVSPIPESEPSRENESQNLEETSQ